MDNVRTANTEIQILYSGAEFRAEFNAKTRKYVLTVFFLRCSCLVQNVVNYVVNVCCIYTQ